LGTLALPLLMDESFAGMTARERAQWTARNFRLLAALSECKLALGFVALAQAAAVNIALVWGLFPYVLGVDLHHDAEVFSGRFWGLASLLAFWTAYEFFSAVLGVTARPHFDERLTGADLFARLRDGSAP
jgi:hypothetical protein